MIARRMIGLFAATPLLAVVLAGCQDSGTTSLPNAGTLDAGTLDAGTMAPPIRALSWLNGPAPDKAEMAGNVVVIDCFASW